MNLASRMLASLERDDERIAITLLAGDGDVTETWSRSRLRSEIAVWQRRFSDTGLVPGDRVVVAPDRHPSVTAVHVALLASGLVVVPLNTALTAPEAASVLDAAGARLALATQAFAARVRGTSTNGVPWWCVGEDGVPIADDASPDDRLAGGADAGAGRGRPRVDGVVSEASQRLTRASATPSAVAPRLVERESSNDALVIHTSGTTGKPKSVPLSHANLTHNLDSLAAVWKRSEDDRLLHVLPLHHYHGLVLALYGSLLAGGEVVMLPRFEARTVLDAIQRRGISVLMGVPTMYARLLDAARDGDDLRSLRVAISGSAPLGASLWGRFRERFGIELIERYGLTETGIVTSNALDAPRAGSVGFPLDGMTIAIRVHADTNESRATDNVSRAHAPSEKLAGDRATPEKLTGDTATHERAAAAASSAASSPHDASTPYARYQGRATARGEIVIAGPTVMRGYGNDPDANARSFHDGYFHSGDLGYFDADGYLWVDGRIKDLIIVGGSNVVPGEVERVLSSVADAAELCVAGLREGDLGEIVAAFVVPREGATPSRIEAELRTAADQGLAPYKRPRRYVFLEQLPRNTMGKVDRKKLTAPTTTRSD